jgi:hypothetical protein
VPAVSGGSADRDTHRVNKLCLSVRSPVRAFVLVDENMQDVLMREGGHVAP